MIIVDSPFHITFSTTNKEPIYACVGKCKKIWWEFDFSENDNRTQCQQCGSTLNIAVKNVHFKVIKNSKRNFKKRDFNSLELLSKNDREDLEKLCSLNAKINHLSKVKEAFVEKAKKEWCKVDLGQFIRNL